MAIGDTTAHLQQRPEATTFEPYLTRYYEDIGKFVTAYLDPRQNDAFSADWMARRYELERLVAGQAIRFDDEIAIARQTRQWAPDLLTRLDAYAAEIERITGGTIMRRDAEAPRPADPMAAAKARIAALAADLAKLSDAPGFDSAHHDAARAQIEAAVAVASAAGAEQLVDQYERYVGALQTRYAAQKRMAGQDAASSPDVAAAQSDVTAGAEAAEGQPDIEVDLSSRQGISTMLEGRIAQGDAIGAAAWVNREIELALAGSASARDASLTEIAASLLPAIAPPTPRTEPFPEQARLFLSLIDPKKLSAARNAYAASPEFLADSSGQQQQTVLYNLREFEGLAQARVVEVNRILDLLDPGATGPLHGARPATKQAIVDAIKDVIEGGDVAPAEAGSRVADMFTYAAYDAKNIGTHTLLALGVAAATGCTAVPASTR